MFGIGRRGRAVVLPAVAALVLVLAPRHAFADGNEGTGSAGQGSATEGTLFGLASAAPAQGAVSNEAALQGAAPIDLSKPISLERVWAEDFHPETDRWTERNNRIKLSLYGCGLFPSGNLRWVIDAAIGVRLAWEVPGFIGIRLDNIIDPLSRMRIRLPSFNTDSTRTMKGFVDCTSLSVAIFNPESSYPANLAMWAGLGVDLWWYHYAEIEQVSIGGPPTEHVHYIDQNVGLNFFFDLQYKITDIFHVGIGFREHLVYAPQTEVGEFYHIDGHQASDGHHTRNATKPVDISPVEEINVTFSILF